MKTSKIIMITVVSLFLGLFVASTILGSIVGTRNGLIEMQEAVYQAQADVQTILQTRSELIPNLVATVKSYTKHEEGVYAAIADARAALNSGIDSGDINQMYEANFKLDSAIRNLLVIVESYPDLKASEQYTALMDSITGIENKLRYFRNQYNEVATHYNTEIRKFPASIIAKMEGLERVKLFEASPEAQNAPLVDFSN